MCKSAHRLLVVAAVVVLAGVLAEPGVAWAQAGPVGPSELQYTGGTRWPDLAYDTGNHVYLVVWGPSVIRGIFIDDSGNAASAPFQISDAALYAQTPRVAYNPDAGTFLVVWHSSEAVETNARGTRVRGRVVSFSDGALGTPQLYSNATYTTRWEVGPAVAYASGSKRFLVAYNIYAATGPEIGARIVDASANPVGGEIGVTATPSDYDREPAVGYFPAANRFLLVWSGSGTAADFVRARVLNASDGAAVSGTITLAETTTTYVPELALNSATGDMFVEWIQADAATDGFRPFGRFVDSTGAIRSPTARLSSTVGSYDANSVAYNRLTGSFFLVTHLEGTQQDMGFEISGSGIPVAAATVVTSVSAQNLTGSFNPRIAASSVQDGWLIATAASFTSLWTQLIGGDGGSGGTGGGTVNPQLTITPVPAGGTVSGSGLNCGSNGTVCQLTFTAPASVTLTATPASGYVFAGWSGACTGTGTTTTVAVDSVMACGATFTAPWTGSGTEPSGCLAAPAVTYAASPGPIGASVGQFTGAVQYPDLAYGSCQQVYLAVWGSGGVIRGRFFSESGAGVSGVFDVSTGAWAQRPRVVYNPNLGSFLVAWHSGASDSRTEIRASVVTYPAGAVAAGTVLSAATYSTDATSRPAIAYSTGSGRYLVAWARVTSTGRDVNARLLDASGATVGSEFAVTTTSTEAEREPGAVYFSAANRFLVVWAGTGATTDFVRGQLYDAGAAAVYGPTMSLAQGSFVHMPDAALNSVTGNAFVAWMQLDSATGGPRPFGRFVSGSGALLSTSAERLSATAGAFLANSIAFNALSRTFFLVTHGSDTLQDVGFEIGGTGTPLGSAAEVTSITAPDLTGSFYPRVAASARQPRWLIGTSASSASLWTQVLGGTQTAPAVTYQLSVTRPTGGTVAGGGIACGTGGSACSSSYASATSVTLTAAPDSGYSFKSWGGSCAGTGLSTTVAVDGVKACTAAFAAASAYTMTVSPRPTGGTVAGAGLNCGVSGSACSVTMPAPMTLGIQATPASGYTFAGWTGDCSGTSASLAISLTGARTCGATFTSTTTSYQLSVTPPTGGAVTGGGIACGSGATACSVTFPSATTVTLSAAASAGYAFASWGGSCSGTGASTTVAVDGVKTCTASFTTGLPTGAPYTMTISPVPTGGSISGAGLNCGTSGAACSVTMPAPMTLGLQATPASGYTFGGWSGHCLGTSPSLAVSLTGARTCSAAFTPGTAATTYQLNVTQPAGGTVTGGGITCGAGGTACSVTFPSSTTVTLTATPDSTHSFAAWGGSCSGTGATTTVAVNGVKTCTATFGALATGAPYTMTISPVPSGGTVTGAGLNCGAGGSACSTTMPAAMTLGLQASPAAGYIFTGWGGNCAGTDAGIYLSLAGARTCTAYFAAGPAGTTTYQLNVTKPTGGTVGGGGITCGTSGTACASTFPSSTTVTLTATPDPGYSFAAWGGSCSGTGATTTVTVDGVKTCTATFGALATGAPYTMTISPAPSGGTVTGAGLNCGAGGGSCSVTMPAAMTLGLQATPAAGYTFTGWGGNCTGATPGIYVPLVGARTCTANFAAR